MDTYTLDAEPTRETGSGASRRLRRAGRIPAVLYGHGSDPKSINLDRLSFRRVLNAAGPNALINLDMGDTTELAIVKELQSDPIQNRVIHVDFQIVNQTERLTVEVPVVLVGEATLVDREGGAVQQQLNALEVSAPVTAIPPTLDVDISDMELNGQIKVEDLQLPANVTTDVDPETVVAVAHITRAALAEEDAADDAEGDADGAEEGDDGGDSGDDAE